jgi:hypothetical protein
VVQKYLPGTLSETEGPLNRNDNTALPSTMKIVVSQKDGHDLSIITWRPTLKNHMNANKRVMVGIVVDKCEQPGFSGISFATPVGIALIER